MAVGKNKKLMKGKKGGKKKVVDVFTKKEWYNVRAPSYFANRNVGKAPVNRTAGTKLAVDGLRGRVWEMSLADLNNDESTYRKIKLCCEEVQGRECLTNFHGMDLTTDKLRSLVKKWRSLVEAFVDVKTTDGYVLRMFCIGFTKKRLNSQRKTCYAQSAQKRALRAKMVEIMTKEASTCDLKELVGKLVPESIGKDIEKACSRIYPLQDVFIRKVKVLKKPRFDVSKLLELHSEVGATGGEKGAPVARTGEFVEPAPLENV
jgi:small subunit ribosomal protein S3Ae